MSNADKQEFLLASIKKLQENLVLGLPERGAKVVSNNVESMIKDVIDSLENDLDLAGEVAICDVPYETTRKKRTFSFEFSRTYTKVLKIYSEILLHSNKEVQNIFDNILSDDSRDFLRSAIDSVLEKYVHPRLVDRKNSGEDLLRLVCLQMAQVDSKDHIALLANTRSTPAQSFTCTYAIIGLLEQARLYNSRGDAAEAYSCLIDANHLIGLYEGSEFATRHLDEVSFKMERQRSAKMKHVKSRELKIRVIDLYFELMPNLDSGGSRGWTSAYDASKVIFAFLEKEASDREENDPSGQPQVREALKPTQSQKDLEEGKCGIQLSTVLSVCRVVHRQEKSGNSLDLRRCVIDELPDEDDEEMDAS